MVKRRGKKLPSSSSAATNNNNAAAAASNNNNSTTTSDEEINRINAVINSKQKTWLERLNSNDPHQREDGCDDITTMVSSSSLANNIDQLMQSLFQSGVLITLVKILLTDTEANVRISAASALQNIAAVGRDNTINALIGLTVPSSSSSSSNNNDNNNNNNTTSFVSALLNLLGETFQVLEDSIGHLKRYNEYQQKKRQLEQQQSTAATTTTTTIPENEIVPHPNMHPDTPSRLLTELLGLCSVLVTTNNSVSNQLGQSTQLLTALTKTTIDSGFGADEIRSSVAKYYPISSQESLACSCAELLYVLANQLATTNNNPVANFLSNSVPEQYRTKIDSLISLSSSSSSQEMIEEMISKSPSRLCVSLYLAGTFIHSFPSQSLRVVPLLAFCIKGESVIKVTSDALPLLSARSVNETHHRMQKQMKERQEQQQTLPEFAKKKTANQSDEDDDEDEDDLVDDRETQLRQGPFRSLKVFHTAFTIANDVLNYVAEGDLPETEYLDDEGAADDNSSVEILEETDDDGSGGDEVMKFVNCGAYEAFQKVGLLSACLMRCGEIVNLPSDVVLRSALFDPSTNGHVMNLQSNFHSTVTAILRFNAMLLVLLPFEPIYTDNNNNNDSQSTQQQQLTAFLSRVPIMWSSAFEGVNDRLNALNYTKTQIQNNNNSGDCASNLWFGITENLYLQIQNLIRMLFFIQKKSNSVSSSSSSSSSPSSSVTVTPEPKQVDLLRTVFFDERYSGITSETRVDITGLMGQIALSAAKYNQVDALGSCTKFLVETLNTAVGRCGVSNNNNNNTSSSTTATAAAADNEEAIDVAAEAADLLMDVFNDERFDADVYRVQQVHGALRQFQPLLRPYASTKGLKRKSPRYQELNGVFRNLGGFLEYKVQNGAA